MNNTEPTETTEDRLLNLSDIARYANATIYSTQKAIDALGCQPVKNTRNRRAIFYPESVKYAVKQWLQEN